MTIQEPTKYDREFWNKFESQYGLEFGPHSTEKPIIYLDGMSEDSINPSDWVSLKIDLNSYPNHLALTVRYFASSDTQISRTLIVPFDSIEEIQMTSVVKE